MGQLELQVGAVGMPGRVVAEAPPGRGFVWMERTPGTGVNADWRFDDTSEHLRLFRQSIRTAHVIGGVTSGLTRAIDG